MKTIIRSAILAAALSLSVAGLASAQATTPATGTLLSLTALGDVEVDPDMATITTGTAGEAKTAAEAMGRNADKMAHLLAALQSQGIDRKDIQTSALNLSQRYEGENSNRRLVGYRAATAVTVRVNDLARLGSVVDALIAAGADTLGNVRFGLSDDSAAASIARREAVEELNAKAKEYADLNGAHIRRLRNLNESSGGMGVTYGSAFAGSPPEVEINGLIGGNYANAVAAGQLTVRVYLQATYELDDPA